MSAIIKPQIRKTSELHFHTDDAPCRRYVFVDKSIYPESKFYAIGRRVERIPENQPDYVKPHRHNCNSFYFFIGDNEDLSGLEAEVSLEGNQFRAEAPSTVMIPERFLHNYKLAKGNGWFFHVALNPSFNESLLNDESCNNISKQVEVSALYKGFEKQLSRPKSMERPIGASVAKELNNPQRYILVNPELFPKAGIYAALHQIFKGKPFDLNQQIHSNHEDEIYIFFSRKGDVLQVNMYGSEKESKKIESPITAYHPKGAMHRYDYADGEGFLLVVLKERVPGAGYAFIPANLGK